MAGVSGTRLFGSVDRIPGLGYVATKFFHLNFLPLLPLGTYFVQEGSEHFGGFQGQRIAWSWKSLLIGYYRNWAGAVAVLLFALVGAETPMFLGVKGRESPEAVFGLIAGLVVALAATLFVLTTNRRGWLIVEVLLHVASVVIWFLAVRGAAANLPPHLRIDSPQDIIYIPCANVVLLSCSLTRLFDRASSDRGFQLAEELGMETEAVEDLLAGRADSA